MGWSDKWSEDWKSLSQDSQTSTREGQLGEALHLCRGLSQEHRARLSPCSSKTLPSILPLTHLPCFTTQWDSEPTESMVPTLVYSLSVSFYSTRSMIKREKFLFLDKLDGVKDTLHFAWRKKVKGTKEWKKTPNFPITNRWKSKNPSSLKVTMDGEAKSHVWRNPYTEFPRSVLVSPACPPRRWISGAGGKDWV